MSLERRRQARFVRDKRAGKSISWSVTYHSPLFVHRSLQIFSDLEGVIEGRPHSSTLVFGADMALTAAKLARIFPSNNVVAMLGSMGASAAAASFERLSALTSQKNLVTCSGNLDYYTTLSLYNEPHIFDVAVLSASVFGTLPLLRDAFFAHLGRILSLSHVSFVEVVDPAILADFLSVLGLDPANFIFEGFISEALRQVGVANAQLTFVDNIPIMDDGDEETEVNPNESEMLGATPAHSSSSTSSIRGEENRENNVERKNFKAFVSHSAATASAHSLPAFSVPFSPLTSSAYPSTRSNTLTLKRVLRVTIPSLSRTVLTGCQPSSKAQLSISTTSSGLSPKVQLLLDSGSSLDLSTTYQAGVPLSLILMVNPLPFSITALARLYLALSLEQDMCPRKIVFNVSQLSHRPLEQSQTDRKATPLSHDNLLLTSLQSQLTMPFSLMEYGSRAGQLSLLLAKQYINSSILSVEADESLALQHWASIENLTLFNNIILHSDGGVALVQKLFESPEFLRYQVF